MSETRARLPNCSSEHPSDLREEPPAPIANIKGKRPETSSAEGPDSSLVDDMALAGEWRANCCPVEGQEADYWQLCLEPLVSTPPNSAAEARMCTEDVIRLFEGTETELETFIETDFDVLNLGTSPSVSGCEASSRSASDAESASFGAPLTDAPSSPRGSPCIRPAVAVHADSTSAGSSSPQFPSAPLGLPPKRIRKPKVYKDPKPSHYCHICQRPRNLVICSNFRTGTCRKCICERCFSDYFLGVDYKTALSRSPSSGEAGGEGSGPMWYCTHCEKKCPQKARCVVYDRAVEKRRVKQLKDKMAQRLGGKAQNQN